MRLDLRNTFDPELDLQHAAFMSYALDKVYEIVESITLEGNFVEFWQSTQKMRLDLRNTLDSELRPLEPRVYELCLPQGIRVCREPNSCMKLCGVLAIHSKEASELRNTLDPKLDLQHAAFMSYALHKVYESVESITLELKIVEFWQSTQKMRLDLRNTLRPGIGPPARRVYELCPRQGIRDCREHNS